MIKNKNRLFHFYVFQHCRVVHRNWANTLVISDIYHSKTLYWYTKANSRLESQFVHQILENHTILHYSDLKKEKYFGENQKKGQFWIFFLLFLKEGPKIWQNVPFDFTLVSTFQIKREEFCVLLKKTEL